MHLETKSLRAVWPWAAAVLSALLLELPFPIAGPMGPWRSVFAWIGLVPLLWALLCGTAPGPKPVKRAFWRGYLCGVLWYAGNCYWIYDTMCNHGGLPPVVSVLMLLGFSLVLGTYIGLFGAGLALVRRSTGRVEWALAAAPFLWVGLDLVAARLTSVPWDQLGYSQVDNALVTRLAPWTGVYGITFLLVAANGLLAGGLLAGRQRRIWVAAGLLLTGAGVAGLAVRPALEPATATAVLVQPNLDVGGDNLWNTADWQHWTAVFAQQARTSCTQFIAGIPETGAARVAPDCEGQGKAPALVAWPESPAPFVEDNQPFKDAMATVAKAAQAPLMVGGIGIDFDRAEGQILTYNSGMVFSSTGEPVGRYDKIHLVPYGEYVPYKDLFSFAHKLTGRVSEFARGREHKVFTLNGRRYGVFICYEAVFADEVRQEARLGAEVLVNLSDDGWYGDTSAPWQHLNMTRMRAIENRRWIVRATNNGVTAAIDPDGRVRQSIARHAVAALAAGFGFRDDVTFYTGHGDVFAWLCLMVGVALVGWAGKAHWRGQNRK